jgi:hypothetical protein
LIHGLKPDIGGICNENLYSLCYYGTKNSIEEFYRETHEALEMISTSDIDATERLAFLRSARKSYGQTALCLSGGASLGYYHLGVAHALFLQGLLPKVISGTSAGALIAAIICTRTDEELVSEVFTPSIHERLKPCEESVSVWWNRFLSTGASKYVV